MQSDVKQDVNGRYEAAAVAGHAQRLVDELRDLCQRVELAGSLRRKKATVKDVEIVVLPTHRAQLLARLDLWVATGRIRKADYQAGTNRWGEKYRGFIYGGIRFELFIADADNWGYLLWLRTGPGDANQYVMQQLIYQKAPCRPAEGYFRECDAAGEPTGARLRVAEERDLFALLGMPMLPPEARTLEAYQAALKPPHWWGQAWDMVEEPTEVLPTQTGMFE
jgi:DNA polymerase/3'-5' exonuclease PolX